MKHKVRGFLFRFLTTVSIYLNMKPDLFHALLKHYRLITAAAALCQIRLNGLILDKTTKLTKTKSLLIFYHRFVN